jgi:ornithine cyclodeaminase
MSRPTTFLYLQQEEVIACGGLDMNATMDAIEKVFHLYDQGDVIDLAPSVIHWGDRMARRVALHTAYVGGDAQVTGIKWIPSNPDNPRTLGLPRSNALTILNDAQTGYPLAVLEGKLISDMRTGAVCGVGAKYLARVEASAACFIGAGPSSRTQLMALQLVLPRLDTILLFDLRRENAERFVREMSQRLALPERMFRIVDSAETAVRGADVIVTATGVNIRHRYLRWEWLRPGALIVNHSVNDVEFDVVERADLVVLDSTEQLDFTDVVIAECHKRGLLAEHRTRLFGAVIAGRQAGRQTDNEIILFSSAGMGMTDVISAKRICDVARARGLGTTLRLWDTPIWY